MESTEEAKKEEQTQPGRLPYKTYREYYEDSYRVRLEG
jgi:hypothetical protein